MILDTLLFEELLKRHPDAVGHDFFLKKRTQSEQ
jgi:hypothetical protein